MLKLHLSRVNSVYGFGGELLIFNKTKRNLSAITHVLRSYAAIYLSIYLSFPTIFHPVSFIDSKSSHTPVSYCIICVVFCSLVLTWGIHRMKTSEAILIDSLAILEVSMEGVLPPWSKDELVLTDS